jgi:hypothetical protein
MLIKREKIMELEKSPFYNRQRKKKARIIIGYRTEFDKE